MICLALVVELGCPFVSILLLWLAPRWRKFNVVVLGAMTPALAFYASIVADYLKAPFDKGNLFAIGAAPFMTFPGYLALLVGGGMLAFTPRPLNSYARFAIGVASAPVSVMLLGPFIGSAIL